MFFWRLKNNLLVFFALFLSVSIFFLFPLFSMSKFSDLEGKHTFFLDSASSQGLRKEKITPLDIFRVKGECVRFNTLQKSVNELLSTYQAKTIFIEEVAGIVSYYCYTEKWQGGTIVNGYKINLHIAVGEEQTVVGFPIIFDGY